jgi:hypothetical protein
VSPGAPALASVLTSVLASVRAPVLAWRTHSKSTDSTTFATGCNMTPPLVWIAAPHANAAATTLIPYGTAREFFSAIAPDDVKLP